MKKMAAVLAALMVLSCGTVVFANPSTSAPDTAKTVTVSKTADGKEVTATVAVESVKNEATKVAKEKADDSVVLSVIDIEYKDTIPASGVQLTINDSSVKKGDNIYLLHQKADKTWEVIHPDKVEDGKVTATFKSLSPVAIVKIAENATLPKTGAPIVLPVAALICAAGAAGCARKVKFN